MSVSINLKALENSNYIREEPPRKIGSRTIHRFILQHLTSNQIVKVAASAIQTLQKDNPELVLVTQLESTETFEDKVRSCPHLIINGNALCLSDKTKAPEEIDILCKDLFFSEAIIEEPVQCTKGHTFEKRHIQAWVNAKGDHCPYDLQEHEIGPLKTDPYLLECIQSRTNSYVVQARVNRETIARVQKIEQEQFRQNVHIKSLPEKKLTFGSIPSTQPFEEAWNQVTQSQGIFNHHSSNPLQDFTLEQKQQFFKKLACQLSIQELKQAISKIPYEHIDQLITSLGIDDLQYNLLIEKLQVLANPTQNISLRSFKGTPSVFESLETAASYFIPDHNPSCPWEAQQMVNMVGMAATAAIILIKSGAAGFSLLGGGVVFALYRKYISKDLPTEIKPSKNLTLAAKEKVFPSLIGRDQIIETVFQLWSATTATVRQHPLLIGESGVGKTAIMQEIARRIALFPENQDIPDTLKQGCVYGCTAADLLPSSSFEGAEKFERFLKQTHKIRDRVIIAIDEVHTFMNETYKDRFGELIKSILDTSTRGMPYTIFATTEGEYNKFIAPYEALARRFQIIKVPLLNRDYTVAVLSQQIQMEYPGLMFDPDLLEYIYDRSDSLKTSNKQPEISKQVLARVLSKLKSRINTSQFIGELNQKRGEKEHLQSLLSATPTINEKEEKILLDIRTIDREIEEINDKIIEEKKEIQSYKETLNKILHCLEALIILATNKRKATSVRSSKEAEKQFKFYSYVVMPELISQKRGFEEKLSIQPLDKETIDSVISEMEAIS